MPQDKPTVSGYPTRTKEELERMGHSLAEHPSCAPLASQSGNRAVLGCASWKSCRFNNATYGNFKGKGPRKIAYFYHTIEGNEKTDECMCWQFVTTLQGAMDDGISMAMKGQRHEVVKIIAQEGETYRTIKRDHIFPKDGKSAPYWGEPKKIEVVCGRASEIQQEHELEEYRSDLSAEYLAGLGTHSVPEKELPHTIAVKVEK